MKSDTIKGIITRGVGGLYCVRPIESDLCYGDEVLCRARGILRRENITPTVGDEVEISLATLDDKDDLAYDEQAARGKKGYKSSPHKKQGVDVDHVIDKVLPRRNLLIRPPVANLDYLFAVVPCASPEPDLLTADKLTVIAENYGIETVIVVNKADLDRARAEEIKEIYSKAGYRVFLLSCESGEGVDVLGTYIAEISHEAKLRGENISGAFAGVSGAGKSTLMTALFPDLNLKTGKVSLKTERGRHTTRHVELYPLSVGESTFWLADTPGFSMLDFTRFDFFPYDELAESFREFADCIGECRYKKCTHLREEGCAVLEKVKSGEISQSRHDSYVRIFDEQRSVPQWKRR
ncbi:MAG: ribosome small subunit-dependent GTPase A [Clostridia bacterium]|nr:ribosome small subunit-dependent GTPase A [Clostridia bacterium]